MFNDDIYTRFSLILSMTVVKYRGTVWFDTQKKWAIFLEMRILLNNNVGRNHAIDRYSPPARPLQTGEQDMTDLLEPNSGFAHISNRPPLCSAAERGFGIRKGAEK